MNKLEYSAGAVSKGFWFTEFRKYNELLKEGNSEKDIRQLQKDENILLAPSETYGMKKLGEVARRSRSLPASIVEMFFDVNIANQKLINLLGIMMTDRFFFEYIYEIYREALMLGREIFEDSSARVFFKNKAEQSEKVASYTDQVIKRLARAYKTYLREAGLIIEKDGQLQYNKLLLDIELEKVLKEPELYPYFKALQGVD